MTDNTKVGAEIGAAGSTIMAVLAFVNQLLPQLGVATPALLGSILTMLEGIVPLLVKYVPEMIDQVKATIDAIKGNEYATPELIAQAEALAAQIDTDWDAAMTEYEANHPEGAA